jgi:hypothetical protein
MNGDKPVTKAPSSIVFACILMIIVGIFQCIDGLVALFKPSLYQASSTRLLLLNYNQWGWIHLIVGVILILSSFSLFERHVWGKVVAVVFATLSALVNFGLIWAAPLESIMIIFLNLYIIYSVVMYQEDPLA